MIHESRVVELTHKIGSLFDDLDTYRKNCSWKTNSKLNPRQLRLCSYIHLSSIFRTLSSSRLYIVEARTLVRQLNVRVWCNRTLSGPANRRYLAFQTNNSTVNDVRFTHRSPWHLIAAAVWVVQ